MKYHFQVQSKTSSNSQSKYFLSNEHKNNISIPSSIFNDTERDKKGCPKKSDTQSTCKLFYTANFRRFFTTMGKSWQRAGKNS